MGMKWMYYRKTVNISRHIRTNRYERRCRERKRKKKKREGIKSSTVGILFYATIIVRASPRKSSTRTGKGSGGKERGGEAEKGE